MKGHGLVIGLASAAALLAALAPNSTEADSAPPTNWAQSSAAGPSARIAAYMDFDSARGRIVLFGGSESTTQYDSDTWEFDGSNWRQAATSGPPSAAAGAMVFDSNRGVSVLFGGSGTNTTLAPITWEWNGSSWAARFTTTQPQAREFDQMTYDSNRHVVVMFGGASSTGGDLSDTWEYSGDDWKQIVTGHSPPARYGAGLAFDPVRNRTVLFGGWSTASGRLNDTWEYDGTDWTQATPAASPSLRWIHSMAYDAALGKVVVFGGDQLVQNPNGPNTLGPNNETWLYGGGTWQQLATASQPSARAMAASAYDSAHASFTIFGGTEETFPQVPLGDTWTLHTPLPHPALSVGSIDFGLQPVQTSTTRLVSLTNSGDAPLVVTSINAGGDFSSTDDCPRSPSALAAAASCSISVTFTASQGNTPSSGALVVADNAGTGSQSIPLTGSGQWGEVNPLSSPLDFGTSPINTSGPTANATETFTNPDAPTILDGVTAGDPFRVTGLDCPVGVVVPAGTTCHVQLAFEPAQAGSFSQQLIIRANTPNVTFVNLTGTATVIPTAISAAVNPIGAAAPTFEGVIGVVASTSATAGSATFSFNGVQVASVPLSSNGSASVFIQLDDSTIPAGAGTYPLVITIHPTDGVHADGTFGESMAVLPASEQLTWNGTVLAVAGKAATLSAVVTAPPGNTQVDFSSHAVWVRFDLTDGSGRDTAYFAQVANPGTSSVITGGLTAGAYSVKATFVAASGSAATSPFVTSADLRNAFAVEPARGGFLAGTDQESAQQVAFEFTAGSTPTGSMVWVQRVQVTGPQGDQRDAYRIVTATSVTSLGTHSHASTAAGTVSVVVVDATNGVHYTAFDQAGTFQLTVNADGSAFIGTNLGLSASLPAGSGINHL